MSAFLPIKTIGLAIVTALTITACKISKDVIITDPNVPTVFRNDLNENQDSSSIADLSIHDFFKDTILQTLITSALEQNYDMQIALKNIEASDLLFKQVKWNYLPDLSLQVNAASNRPSDNSLNGLSAQSFLKTNHIEDYTASLNLSWEADIWGKIKNQKQAALAAYLQTQEARKAIQTSLVSNVAKGYYNLLMLDAQLEAVKKNVALNDSTVRIVQLQFESGQVTALAVEQAKSQKIAAQQLIPKLEQDILLQENALSILTGQLPAEVRRAHFAESIKATSKYNTGFPADILKRRPDVRNAELNLTIANARVGISKANMYPALRITASGGTNAFKASNWFNIPASLFGMVSGSLVQPLLNKKYLKTQFEVAKVDREKQVLFFRQTVLTAVGDVSDALAKVDKLSEQYTYALDRNTVLQKAISNANYLFQSGMANYLEVLTAQSNALQNDLDIASIKRDQLMADVDLYRSLGGGLK
ncbi:efflux transporter outer membrane subunit [Taibaiella lutea]|uniref:Efflux transporter outer membrane subunit n=1 Tax=Taibaiella lutea TaxID=2608001 RepID=A0A5M6CB22_9BACT|nr:efflux transporter outer membrane subunit [Taibaiella lutea]KAA5532376.1 efflux transporter outer membrane subunit [Taibaiella lutea]